MACEIFIDTSGFYALLVKDDATHGQAAKVLTQSRRARNTFVTSDYVLDETATLLMARRKSHLLEALWKTLDVSHACRIEWMNPSWFLDARALMLRYADRDFSFTDCTSFALATRLKIRKILTKDRHFQEMGFGILLEDT